jgi:trimeric autotransporter adhesin
MSELSDESVQLATAVKDAVVALRTLVNGNVINLNALDTDEKGNLVEAVNELKSGQVAAVQRANHTGEQAQSTVTNLVTDLAGKSATSHNHAGVYDPAGSAAAAQSAAIQRANHTGTQAISTVTGLQTAIDGKSSTAHTHSNAEVNTSIAASPATSATAMGLGTANTPTFAGLNVTGRVNQTGLGNSTYFGDEAGATDDLTSNINTGVGYQALKATTTGSANVAIGARTLYSNSSGSYNLASGYNALRYNTIGNNNVASGVDSLFSNSSGSNNVANGVSSLYSNSSGNYNLANGYQSGRYIANGTTSNATSSNSVYLGANTKALASGDTNEIVIGYDATGIGSNTVTLGNSSIVTTALRGNVGIGTTSPSVKLDVLADADSNALHLYSTVGATVPRVYTSTSTGDGAFLNSYQGGGGPANYRRLFDIGVNAALAGESAIRFITKAAGVEPAEVVRIDSAGNVGIGTTAPSAKMDILAADLQNQLRVSNTSADSTTKYCALVGRHYTNSEENVTGMLITSNSSITGGAVSIGGGIGSANAANNVVFYTAGNNTTLGGSERMRVTPVGNVGIGTASPSAKLEVAGSSKFLGTTHHSWFNNGSSEDTYIRGGKATSKVYINDSHSADVVIASGGGNVGIGTTTPAEKLDVVGNIKASGVIKKGVLTVGTLPGSPTAGMSSYVTDSSQPLAAGIGTTLVAGGANFTPVHYNGTNWIIG